MWWLLLCGGRRFAAHNIVFNLWKELNLQEKAEFAVCIFAREKFMKSVRLFVSLILDEVHYQGHLFTRKCYVCKQLMNANEPLADPAGRFGGGGQMA